MLNSNSLIYQKQLEFNEKARTLTHYVSTETINCYGYRLLNAGMNQAEYRTNPVVLWQHELEGGLCSSAPKPKDLIIGKNLSLEIQSKGIVAVTQFAETELGTDIMELNRDGLLNAWSVRWEFLNDEATDYREIDEVPTILNWKPKEYSSVVMPGNPGATNELSQMLSIAKTDRLRRFLVFDLAKAEIKKELAEITEKYALLKSELDANKQPDYDKIKKELKDELKAEYGRFKQETNSHLLKFADRFLDLKGDAQDKVNKLASALPAMMKTEIDKYVGKETQ